MAKQTTVAVKSLAEQETQRRAYLFGKRTVVWNSDACFLGLIDLDRQNEVIPRLVYANVSRLEHARKTASCRDKKPVNQGVGFVHVRFRYYWARCRWLGLWFCHPSHVLENLDSLVYQSCG